MVIDGICDSVSEAVLIQYILIDGGTFSGEVTTIVFLLPTEKGSFVEINIKFGFKAINETFLFG